MGPKNYTITCLYYVSITVSVSRFKQLSYFTFIFICGSNNSVISVPSW